MLNADPNQSSKVLALHAVRVSNDIYGSDLIGTFEAAKGYTRPFCPTEPPVTVDADLLEAHQNLLVSPKLTGIMSSPSVSPADFRTGDLDQVFYKRGRQKRGRWLSPRQVIKSDHDSGMFTVSGAGGHTISVAFKYARPAYVSSDIADMLQQSIDALDEYLDELLSSDIYHVSGDEVLDHNTVDDTTQSEVVQTDDCGDADNVVVGDYVFDDVGDYVNRPKTTPTPMPIENDQSAHVIEAQSSSPSEPVVTKNDNVALTHPSIGERVGVYWPDDNAYYAGSLLRLLKTVTMLSPMKTRS